MEKNWDNICMVTQIQAFLDNNKDKAVDFQQLAAQHGELYSSHDSYFPPIHGNDYRCILAEIAYDGRGRCSPVIVQIFTKEAHKIIGRNKRHQRRKSRCVAPPLIKTCQMH